MPHDDEAALIAEICDPIPTRKPQQALRALIRGGGRIDFDGAVTALWPDPDDEPENVRLTLNRHIYILNQCLIPPARVKSVYGDGVILLGVPGIVAQLPEPLAVWPTKSERTVLDSLMDGRVHSWRTLATDLHEWREPPPGAHDTVSVLIHKLRKKLAPGWEIQTVWGRGWKLIRS